MSQGRGKSANSRTQTSNTTTTNATLDADVLNASLLVDTGFSGVGVVGDRTLAISRRRWPQRFRRTLRNSPKPTKYVFGSGKPVIARRQIIVSHPLLGDVTVDVVPGQLPFLIGRKLLKRAKISINFEDNFIESTQPDSSKIRQSGSAYLISLKDTEQLLTRVGASGKSTSLPSEDCAAVRPAQRAEDAQLADGDKIGVSSAADTPIASSASHQGTERAVRHSRQQSSSEVQSNKSEKLTKEFACQYACCTAFCADFNVFTAAQEADEVVGDRELEENAIEGWIRQTPSTEEVPSTPAAKQLPTLRERSGTDPMISKNDADILNKRHPSRAWFITAGFLQRLHLLRHAPAKKLIEFLENVVPLKARQRNTPEFRRWKAAISAYCEHIIKSCASCNAFGPTIRRVAGLGVYKPGELGRADIFILDYSLRLCALCVVDAATGWTLLAIIDTTPPNGKSVFETYLCQWAAYFGFHEQLGTDPDGLFRGVNVDWWEAAGTSLFETGAGAHFSNGQVEQRIKLCRWSIDRIRFESPPDSKESWRVVLSILQGCINGEQDASKTTASKRVFGRDIHLMRTALTDSYTTASGNHSLTDVAETTRAIWNQTRCDRRFRLLLKTSSVPGDIGHFLAPGTVVAVFREKSAGRSPSYIGPCTVLGVDKQQAKYLLNHSGSPIYADKAHIRLWHDQDMQVESRPDPRQLADLRRPIEPQEEFEPISEELQERARDKQVERELARDDAYAQLQRTHLPPTRKPTSAGPAAIPEFHKLYSDPQRLALAQGVDAQGVTCPRCRWQLSNGKSGGQKKAHQRHKPGCLLYVPPTHSDTAPAESNVPALAYTVEGGDSEQHQQIRDKNPKKPKKYVSFVIPAERYNGTDPWAEHQRTTRRPVERHQSVATGAKWVPKQPKGILTTSVQEPTCRTTEGDHADGTQVEAQLSRLQWYPSGYDDTEIALGYEEQLLQEQHLQPTSRTTEGAHADGTQVEAFSASLTSGDLAPERGESRRKRKERLRAERVSAAHTIDPGVHVAPEAMTLTFKDLVKDLPEDTRWTQEFQEETFCYTATADGTEAQVESKYLYKWDDLSPAQKDLAYGKALSAYDKYGSWQKGADMSKQEKDQFIAEQHELGRDVTVLDCTTVRDAKLKNGQIIGKVRIAPRGYGDLTDKARFFSTSPTASSVSVRNSELVGMQAGMPSHLFDVSDAFFSGELLREDEVILVRVPSEVLRWEKADEKKPYRRLLREVPGCKGASSSWFRTFTKKMSAWNWFPTSVDPALFTRRDENGKLLGSCPLHVDDGKIRAEPWVAQELFKRFREDKEIELSTVEEQKRGQSVEFCGVRYTEKDDGEILDQDIYVRNKLSLLDLNLVRGKQLDDELSKEAAAIYGTTIGRLIWILPTQLRWSYEISYLSRYRAYPRVKHFRRLAQVVTQIKNDPQHIFLPRFHPGNPIKVVAIVDAGQGEEADPPLKTRDHQCVLIALTSPVTPNTNSIIPGSPVMIGLLSFQACGVARITHASFDFEAICAVSSLDILLNSRELVGELTIARCPSLRERGGEARREWRAQLPGIELHTDSMGLVKAVRLGATQSLTSRRRRDILDLRDAMRFDDLVMIHIDGPTNPVDVGTKRDRTDKAQVELRKITAKGRYTPVASSDFHNTFGTFTALSADMTWLHYTPTGGFG